MQPIETLAFKKEPIPEVVAAPDFRPVDESTADSPEFRKQLNIGVISNRDSVAPSETFIEAVVREMPGVKLAAGGCPYPYTDLRTGRHLIDPGKMHSVGFRIARRLRNRTYHEAAAEYFLKPLIQAKIDVLLCQYLSTGVAMMDLCRESDIPIVVHCHGYDVHRVQSMKEYGDRMEELGSFAKAFIVVSQKMKTELEALGVPASKIRVRPCGVDLSKFACVDPSENPPHFITVGRMVDKKAPYLSIIAFRDVVRRCPEAKLIVIGEGELAESCHNITQAMGLVDHVEFRGVQSNDAVQRALRHCRGFVQHSITPQRGPFEGDSEGTPVSILEASATGIPIVSTRHAGIQECVKHGETGLLCDERDVAAMADHITYLAQNPSQAREMGLAGRRHMESHYSMKDYLREVRETLCEAAARPLAR